MNCVHELCLMYTVGRTNLSVEKIRVIVHTTLINKKHVLTKESIFFSVIVLGFTSAIPASPQKR